MVKFTVFGFEISITFGFLLVISLLSLIGYSTLGFTAVASCIIHELGHCFAAVLLNVKMKNLMLWAGGVQMQRESRLISFSDEIIILLSGPLFNIIFAVFYALCGMENTAGINLVLALFNFLPYSSLDGGCIIKAYLEKHDYSNDTVQKIISLIFGAVILTFLYLTKIGNITAFATIILLTINEFTEK